MGDRQLKWIVVCAAVLTVVGVTISLSMGRSDFAVGVAVGGVLSLGNLWVLARLTTRILAAQNPGSSVGLFLLKMGLLFGAVFGAFKLIPMNLFGFILGLSVVVVAVTLSAILGPVPEPDAPAAKDDGTAVKTE